MQDSTVEISVVQFASDISRISYTWLQDLGIVVVIVDIIGHSIPRIVVVEIVRHSIHGIVAAGRDGLQENEGRSRLSLCT